MRKPEQAALLRAIGATYVCDASAPSFIDDLTEALVATGATLAFDAIGGGRLAGQILVVHGGGDQPHAKEYSRYGSTTHKQVYLYGGLDTGPTEFRAASAWPGAWAAGCCSRSCRRSAPARAPGAEARASPPS